MGNKISEFCKLANQKVILVKTKVEGVDKYCYECNKKDICESRLNDECLRQKYGLSDN